MIVAIVITEMLRSITMMVMVAMVPIGITRRIMLIVVTRTAVLLNEVGIIIAIVIAQEREQKQQE